jgi:hypothetical protein
MLRCWVFLLWPILVAAQNVILPPFRLTSNAELDLKTLSKHQIGILEKLNRADAAHLRNLPQLVVPSEFPEDELLLSPFPADVDSYRAEPKLVLVNLAIQAFAAYEAGRLVRWGPISSGSKRVPTPPGTYHLNWKAKRHVSTDDPRWILTWYFNYDNKSGRAFHHYPMPGYPASHSCARLLLRDAQWLYGWGETWMLSENRREVLAPGTKVILEGVYDFSAPPPWRVLP